MKLGKKIFNVFLAFALVLTMSPTSALADDPDPITTGELEPLTPGDTVTDPGLVGEETSTELSDFLDASNSYIKVGNTLYHIGQNITVTENSTLEFILHFAEDSEDGGLQFATEMTYTLPGGLDIPDMSDTRDVTVHVGGNDYTVKLNYTVANGVLTATFDEAASDPVSWENMLAASNTEFSVEFTGTIEVDTTTIEWDLGITTDVVVEPATHNLSIVKTGVHKRADGVVEYEITVTATGANTNVEIADTITGTALTLDTTYGVIETPNMNGNTTYNDNGFTHVIPAMADGDTVKLKYRATVDYNALTGNGTVAETANSVSADSDEYNGEIIIVNHDMKDEIQTRYLAKSIPQTKVIEGKTYLKWTVDYNMTPVLSAAGGFVQDSIPASSQEIMTFCADPDTGAGIVVEVYDAAGALVRTDTVAVPSDFVWTYNIPTTDTEPYYYTFTYWTVVDTADMLAAHEVSNNVGATDVQPVTVKHTVNPLTSNKLAITKEATSITAEEIQWKVTMRVPAEGLPVAVLTDTLPSGRRSSTTYYDSLDVDSLTITGLVEGESYSDPVITNRDFTITFYQDEEQTVEGLQAIDGTTVRRTITVTYSTKSNQDWMKLASSRVDFAINGPLSLHRNTARLSSGDEAVSAFDEVYSVAPKLFKNGSLLTETDENGYPLFYYRVHIYGVEEGRDIELEDTFDTSIFELVTDDISDITSENMSLIRFREDTGAQTGNRKIGDYFTQTDTGVTISIPYSRLFHKSDNTPYIHYAVCYVLRPKDDEALKKLYEAALENDGLVNVDNTVSGEPFGTASATVPYTYNPVDKEYLGTVQEGGATYAQYKIIFNAMGIDLAPDADFIEIVDTPSDTLTVDVTSVAASPKEAMTGFDVADGSVTYTVADATPVTITYRARINGEVGDSVSYSNTVEALGYSKTTATQTITLEPDANGSATVYSIRILKHQTGNVATVLEGATFALFNADDTPVTDRSGEQATFTTGADGIATVMGSRQEDGWTLTLGHEYYVQETGTPIGYLDNDVKYYFTIDNVSDYRNDIYVDNDLLLVANAPILTEIPVAKSWADDNDRDGIQPDKITVRLYADGTLTGNTLELSAANGWADVFKNLPKYANGKVIDYTVDEIAVSGYALTVTGSAEDGYLLTNTHEPETVDISVTKSWFDGEDQDGVRPSSITLSLLAGGEPTGKTLTLTAADKWEGGFSGLYKYENGEEIVYTLEEPETGDYESVITGSVANGFTVTNSRETDTVLLQGSKTWNDDENAYGTRPESIEITLLAGGVEVETKTVTAADGWAWNFGNLPKNKDGEPIEYTVLESAVPGYTATYDGLNVANDLISEDKGTATLEILKVRDGDETVKVEGAVFRLSNGMTATTDGNGIAKFEIDMSDAGEGPVYYTLSEVSAPDGYVVTDDTWQVTFTRGEEPTVELKGSVFELLWQWITGVSVDYADGRLTVANVYKAEGEVQFTGTKKLTGRDLNDAEFSFTLSENGTVIETVDNDADGNITFSTIKYDLEDVGPHTYTIAEVPGNVGGVTYDTNTLTVTVEVSDNGDGTLSADVTLPSTGIYFENIYGTTGSVVLEATKDLTGRDLAAGEFSFTVYNGDKAVATGSNDADGKIVFTSIPYTLDDVNKTYTYTIKEDAGTLGGVSYSEQEFSVDVTVTDNGDGSLKAEATYASTPIFENIYKAEGEAQFTGTKKLTGRDLNDAEFSFTLSENGTVIETVDNDADGNITFSTIKYDLEDVGPHTYLVTEDRGDLGGVQYSTQRFEITVEVSDNGDGTLNTEVTYTNGDILFENIYTTKPFDLELVATKDLTGRDMNDSEFSFTATEDGKEVATGANDADGNIKFTGIEYNLEDVGTHIITIAEDRGSAGGVDYSIETYTITVNVADNGDGTLAVTPIYPEQGVVFHNVYTAAEAVVTLGAQKNYTGATLEVDMFSFELKDADGEVVETVTNAEDGSIAFSELTFTEEGEFVFTISEVIGKASRVTYDETVYTVTITVIDNQEGKLVATVDTQKLDLVFNNKYTPPSGPGVPRTADNTGTQVLSIGLILAASAFGMVRVRARRPKGKHTVR